MRKLQAWGGAAALLAASGAHAQSAAVLDCSAGQTTASVTIVTGLIFIVCVLAFRRGIMGELIAWLQGRGKS